MVPRDFAVNSIWITPLPNCATNSLMKIFEGSLVLCSLLFCPVLLQGALLVTADPPEATAGKVLVKLAMKNTFTEKVESARAVVFLLDERGKVVGQTARWVIGGAKESPALAPGATNVFNFVIATDKPITTTNLTAKVSFTRVVLEGGKLADVGKEVRVRGAGP